MPKLTIFQKLSNVLSNSNDLHNAVKKVNSYGFDDSEILFRTSDRDEYNRKLSQFKQQNFLAKQWRRASYELENKSLAGLNEVKLMYRDADLMDLFPEIGAALDLLAEETCALSNNGQLINVYSKSERVKSILQDLLVNRLQINTMLPMICRSMCKYGNSFLLLEISSENGVTNWKQLPVYEIERYENGDENPYASAYANTNNINLDKVESTKFVWAGQTEFIPYRNWQIAHFRLLYDSLLLPYGISFLNKARRHWRILSMMEDAMLIYRLERSIERRVFKINVGGIDDADVPAYVEEIANNFKRKPIIDPLTGQVDLKKCVMNVSEDFFLPTRDDNASSPIETLPGAQNLTAMDDIKFIQNKVLAALRIPKSFLNFEENTGDGKNLSMLDIRFTRTVNRVQQALLMELNKVCIIHLYLLGFEDELTNFSLTMNNPSSQAEMLELENLAKKITTAKDAISDAGNGIQLMSWTRACKEIMGWSDKEISDNLEEIRLEHAFAAELEKTSQIIKRTGVFDKVDNIYGEPGAQYSEAPANGEEGEGAPGGGGGGGIGGGAPVGNEDFDMPGDEEGEEQGAEGEMDMNSAAQENAADVGGNGNEGQPQSPMGEHLNRMFKKIINEQKLLQNELAKKSKKYTYNLIERKEKRNEQVKRDILSENIPLSQKNFIINKEINELLEQLGKQNKD